MPSNAWWKLRFKVRNKIKTFSNANILFISAIGSFLSNFRCGSEGFCTVEAPCLVSELVGVWNNGGFENRDCKLIQEAKQIKIKISTLHQNYKKTSVNLSNYKNKLLKGTWTGDQKKAEEKIEKKVSDFKSQLGHCFNIACKDMVEKINSDRKRSNVAKQEDICFYYDQMKERKMFMSGKDSAYTAKHVKAKARKETYEKREKAKEDQKLESSIEEDEFKDQFCDEEADRTDSEVSMEARGTGKKRKKSDKISIELSIEELVESVSIPCVRASVGSGLQTGIVASILNKANIDLESIPLSQSTVERIRNKAIETQAQAYREKVISKFKGRPTILHFDTKLVIETTAENITRQIERLAVSVTSPNAKSVLELDELDDELLGVIEAESGKGEDQAVEIYNLVISYGLEEDIFGVCTDTTSSNTGKYKGAIILLEGYFERSLLWFMCRRHSSEVHISHAMEALTGVKTKGPRRGIYTKLQKIWPDVHEEVKRSKDLVLFDWKKYRGTILGNMAEESKNFLSRALATSVFKRGDYKKIAENSVVYLGKNASKNQWFSSREGGRGEFIKRKYYYFILKLGGKVENYSPAQPFACHEARFAADSWYILILQMTSKIIDVMTAEESKWISTAADFVAAFHVPHFLKSTMIVKASKNDLDLIKHLQDLKLMPGFKKVAQATLDSVLRHTWYFADNIVMLSILDNDVTDDEKIEICQKLWELETPNLEDSKPHKPEQFPSDFINSSTELKDFVTPRSWNLFYALGFKKIDLPWLQCNPDEWILYDSFKEFEQIGTNIVCTNDVAERAIKLVQVGYYLTKLKIIKKPCLLNLLGLQRIS